MKFYHNSQEPACRRPFGAAEAGTAVRLFLQASDLPEPCRVFLRIWTKAAGESLYAMTPEGEGFSYTLTLPEQPQLVWYLFRIDTNDGCWYYGNNQENLGGEGQLSREQPPSYQITVYRRRPVPAWYRQAIVYQIFPDRYHRGRDWLDRTRDSQRSDWKGARRVLRLDWEDAPAYTKDSRGNVTHWDFFGGTLEGIREKLDTLESLGIEVLYLNPVFEAASNHRYDTADYHRIDPRLGDEESFRRLCREARDHGISILLDGVFSHTGSDSRYFDRYENYGGQGAWSNPDSPYAGWYRFTNREQTEYDSWWGVRDLPTLQKENASYQRFLYGAPDGVVRRWMREGARGWRLDVADELPDGFIRGIKEAVVETDPEGLLLGEVWEDASHKVSYGTLRGYLLGDELDGVMNYPLREILQNFLLGVWTAGQAFRRVMSLYENYPRESFFACLNLTGSHDRMRVLTLLGREVEEKRPLVPGDVPLAGERRRLAVGRLGLLLLLQMTLPGVPCLYYGDEAGVEGGTDPDNRAPYPWGREDGEILTLTRQMIALRRAWTVWTEGDFAPFAVGDEVLGFRRKGPGDEMVILVNRCPDREETVTVESDTDALELLTSTLYRQQNGTLTCHVPALSGVVLRLEKDLLREKPMTPGTGILCHITSLPSAWGMGQLGEDARRFVRFLEEAGQTYWQILPLNPPDGFDSPYAAQSAFSGHEALLAPEELVSCGLLTEQEIRDTQKRLIPAEEHGFALVRREKKALLRIAFSRFVPDEAYEKFCAENAGWLWDTCLFGALQDRWGDTPWQSWPTAYRDREEKALAETDLIQEADFYRFCQYQFHRQWKDLKTYANCRGIAIIGDLPFYVGENSADTWAHRELFHLDGAGFSTAVTGVPPDGFSREGQCWNNPTYRWNRMAEDRYRWWIQRLEQAAHRYDWVRLDHFRGFEQYWEVPKGHRAADGCWKYGPGRRLFEALERTLGELPLLAEDLGTTTAAVRNLVHVCGVPGMDIFQFSAEARMTGKGYRARQDAVLYSGTHDNQTLVGWCKDRFPEGNYREEAKKILHILYQSDAPMVIVPLQDVLGLGEESRMNTPGQTGGNWHWRFSWEEVSEAKAEELRKLTERKNRTEAVEKKQ